MSYLTKRKRYRNLLERKKIIYKEKEWTDAKNDKTGKKFWKIVNKQRNEE